MKKYFAFLIVLLFIICIQSDAQKIKFGIGPVASLVVGDLSKFYTYGYGGELDIKYSVTKEFEIYSNVGLHKIIGKTIYSQSLPEFGIGQSSFKAKPLNNFRFLMGCRYFSGNLFGGFGIGLSSQNDVYRTGVSLSPQVGYRIQKLDFIAEYISNQVPNQGDPIINIIGLKTIYYF